MKAKELNNKDALNLFYQELDQQMNSCAYYQRNMGKSNRMTGYYVRDGKKVWVHALWDGYQINYDLGTTKTPVLFPKLEVIEYRDAYEKFLKFIKENGWQKSWYKPRDRSIQRMKELGFKPLWIKMFGG